MILMIINGRVKNHANKIAKDNENRGEIPHRFRAFHTLTCKTCHTRLQSAN